VTKVFRPAITLLGKANRPKALSSATERHKNSGSPLFDALRFKGVQAPSPLRKNILAPARPEATCDSLSATRLRQSLEDRGAVRIRISEVVVENSSSAKCTSFFGCKLRSIFHDCP